MNTLLRSEYVALLCFSLFLYTFLGFAWWWYLVLFLVPDIGMLGYLINPKVGAWTYNATHLISVAIVVYLAGYLLHDSYLALAGIIMIGHTSFDRILGYGLKLEKSFKQTHLGKL